MRVAVLSDIHANLHALDAVLEAVDRDPVDRLWCLGDVVGYGPKPNECCDAIRARADVSLCGNHDLAVRGTLDLHEFSGDAAVAAAWTQTVLRDDALEWLKTLEPAGRSEGVGLFHGSARDPVWEYVLSDEAAAATLLLTDDQLVLVGHSHVALHVALRGSELEGALAPGGTALGLGEARWVVNPGSVGQPRDGDPDAAYLVLDLDARTATFRRVPYDIEATQAEMRAAGLPELLALRLAAGQ
ncbi:MAG TPA: metallophosphoesterase family protein [Gaiellaceae bacterium]|nr:metallophosphoesterase family protein [Gaiellaceae bacterium]